MQTEESQAVVTPAVEATGGKQLRLLHHTLIFSVMTFISRIAGFARDIITSQVFGATWQMDAFLVAFKIPNFLRRLFAEGGFAQAFVPIMAEYRAKCTMSEIKALISNVTGVLMGAVGLGVIIGIVMTPFLVKVVAPGFIDDPYKLALASDLLKITLPYIFFISIVALSGGVLNTFENFLTPALTPLMLNIAFIFAALYLVKFFAAPIYALAWAVLIGGVLQLLLQIIPLYRKGLLIMPSLNKDLAGVMRILKNMLPILFGVSVAQLGIMMDTIFASFLPSGSISWIYYADRLMQFPLGMFGVGIATVVLPHLAREHALHDSSLVNKVSLWGIRLGLLIALPATVGLGLLASPIMMTLFMRGNFSLHDATMSAQCLAIFSIGLVFFILVKILASIFYAQQDVRTPVKIAAVSLFINIICNILLLNVLQHVAIAVSVSIAAICNAALLAIMLLKKRMLALSLDFMSYCGKLIVASLVLALFLIKFTPTADVWSAFSFLKQVAMLVQLIAGGALVYLMVLLALRLNIIYEVKNIEYN